MRASSKLFALSLALALQPAVAGVVSLDFEDIAFDVDPLKTGTVKLDKRYEKKGWDFSGAAWGTASVLCQGKIAFVPRDGGCSALLLANNPRDLRRKETESFTLNFADGFIGGSSLYYSALSGANANVSLFEGLDGTGKRTNVGGLMNTDCTDVPDALFCRWKALEFNFSGVARSIVVTGTDQFLMIDDISLVQATVVPPTPTPEPASLALALSALGALGWARKRAVR